MLGRVPLSFRASVLKIVARAGEGQPQAVKSRLFRVVPLALADDLVVGTTNMPIPKTVLLTFPDLRVHLQTP